MTFRLLPRSLAMIAAATTFLACSPTAREDRTEATASTAAIAALSELPSPAGPASGEPFLAADARGGLHLTWLQRSGDSTVALRYARLEGEAWSTPSTIVERRDLFVNWADFPAVLVADDGSLLAYWLQRRPGGKYSYDIMLTRSADSGRTWTPGALLHRDGVAAEHGFVALWPSSQGGAEAAWLDGRGHAETDVSRHATAVYTNAVAPDGSLGVEQALDLRTCDCCQVAATVTTRGPVVAYRDRSDDEIRDIAVVRRVDGTWSAPSIVHRDDWKIDACPVNGPALAARGDTVALAWFTGAQDTARVRIAFSTDGGARFGAPQRIDDGAPAGRVDVEMLDDGSAVVSWLERTDSAQAEVRLRRVRRDGSAGAAVVLARAVGGRASGFPRLATVGNALFVAWTDVGDSARVRLSRFDLAALP